MVQVIEENRAALAELCRRFHVERLDVFGSAATGPLRDDSDLDFLVEFLRVDALSPADQYFGLLAALEDLFGREIDLLTRAGLRNRFFVDSVESTRRSLYAA